MTSTVSKALFSQSNNEYDIFEPAEGHALPAATYQLKYADPRRGYYLERVANLPVPTRLYGKQHQERIMATWEARTKEGLSTGVWLDGEKGSGKTLLVALLSLEMRRRGRPTVLISQAYHGPDFNSFVGLLGEACLVFDEFEKVYKDEKPQNALLTVFAGSVVAQHLYCLTTNQHGSITDAMLNRPSRIRYLLAFRGLTEDVARAYVEERLNDKSQVERLVEILQDIHDCNFDIMQAIVEEHNRFGGDLRELLAIMNISRQGPAPWQLTFEGTVDREPTEKQGCTKERLVGEGTEQVNLLSVLEMHAEENNTYTVQVTFKPQGNLKEGFKQYLELEATTMQRLPDGSVKLAVDHDCSGGATGFVVFTPVKKFSDFKQAF